MEGKFQRATYEGVVLSPVDTTAGYFVKFWKYGTLAFRTVRRVPVMDWEQLSRRGKDQIFQKFQSATYEGVVVSPSDTTAWYCVKFRKCGTLPFEV